MPLEPSTRLGRYEILATLGSGGMGEVYRARDSRLGREVAVKVLPESMAGNPDLRARFERETRTVAALTHPNILAIHDVGTEGTVLFAVTELLEGETLRVKLSRSTKIAPPTAIGWCLQIARGLSAAHGKGVVHRDLKPENLFVTWEGRVTILDFGLASAPSSGIDNASLATMPGTVLGTMGYMAPEQVRGAHADPPADVFAFGVVLYEMLSGTRPFQRSSAPETMAAILLEPPTALPAVARGVPAALVAIVDRCLAKKPEGRYASGHELVQALEAAEKEISGKTELETTKVLTPVSAPRIPSGAAGQSIAVLPFRNLSGGSESDYFSDGVTEEIISSLSRIPELHVAARTSSFAFRGKDEDVRQIGAQLGVATVLEGSVRQAGQRLRLTAQLIDVTTGYHLWSERFDRTLEDVFAVQDEIAQAIASTLKVKLLGGGPATRDVAAYDLFLKGRYFINKRALSSAIEPLEEAIERDPGFVGARTSLADAIAIRGFYGGIDTREAFARSKRLAEDARALDPESSDVDLTLGIIEHYYGWDLNLEESLLRRSIDHAPKNGLSRSWLGLCLAALGRWDEGIEVAREAVALEPYVANYRTNVAWAHYYAGRYDEAVAEAHQGLSIDPHALYPLWTLGSIHHARGAMDDSVRTLEEAARQNGEQSQTLSILGAAYAFAGNAGAAQQVLQKLDERSSTEYVAPLFFAQIHTALGRLDDAFEQLETAAAHRNAFMHALTTFMRMWEPAWRDARFESFKMKLVPMTTPRWTAV